MPDLQQLQQFMNSEHAWVIQVFIIVFLTLLANYIAVRLLDRVQQQMLRTSNLWDDALVAAARRPAAFAIWVIGIAWAAEVVQAMEKGMPFVLRRASRSDSQASPPG